MSPADLKTVRRVSCIILRARCIPDGYNAVIPLKRGQKPQIFSKANRLVIIKNPGNATVSGILPKATPSGAGSLWRGRKRLPVDVLPPAAVHDLAAFLLTRSAF
jgi:hypothetical protein